MKLCSEDHQPQTQHEYDEDDLMQTTKIRSAQLSENFTMMVCGPSGAGKTMFIAQLITHRKTLCEKPPVYIVIVYCNPDPKLIEYGDTNINVNDSKHQYTKDYLMKLFVKTLSKQRLEMLKEPKLRPVLLSLMTVKITAK